MKPVCFPICLALGALALAGTVLGADAPPPFPAAAGTSATAVLTVADYLNQVSGGNPGIQSAQAVIRALDLSSDESETVFSPQLTGGFSHLENRAQNSDPLFLGESTVDTSWNLGLSKRWTTGTLTSLSYVSDLSQVNYPSFPSNLGIPQALLSLIVPSSSPYYTSTPTLSITQPLIKDFLAAGPLATVAKVRMTAASNQALLRFQIQQTLFVAKQAYIQLALARAAVRVEEESLARNLRILDWAQRRESQNLADRVDTLQTEAAVRQVEINLAQTHGDLENAVRAFNTLRGQPDATTAAPLEELAEPAAGALERKHDRLDVQAADYDLRSRQAAVDEVTERYLPDLSVYGTASLTGRDLSSSSAVSESLTTNNPVTTVGVRLSANLDVPIIGHAIEGARLARESGERDLAQKHLDLDKDWFALRQHWQTVKEQLRIAAELEALQKEKADREKDRFRNGRTTNFQVLKFEDDYAQAELLHLRLLGEAHTVAAQAELYNADLE